MSKYKMLKDYELSFISNEDLFFHVKETIDFKLTREVAIPTLQYNNVFHQRLLKSIANNNRSLSSGFDLIDKDNKIFAEVKRKCPSMNSFSARDTYIKMQHTVLSDRSSLCYLVELLAKPSQNALWKVSIDGQQLSHNNIRRISVAKFYHQITGVSSAFKELHQVLPRVFNDVMALDPSPQLT